MKLIIIIIINKIKNYTYFSRVLPVATVELVALAPSCSAGHQPLVLSDEIKTRVWKSHRIITSQNTGITKFHSRLVNTLSVTTLSRHGYFGRLDIITSNNLFDVQTSEYEAQTKGLVNFKIARQY